MNRREKQLKDIDRKLQALDYDAADWIRHQSVRIRELREAVRGIVEADKEDEKPQRD